MVLEAVGDAALERLLLELARVGHGGVHQLDALFRDASGISIGEVFLQFKWLIRWAIGCVNSRPVVKGSIRWESRNIEPILKVFT